MSMKPSSTSERGEHNTRNSINLLVVSFSWQLSPLSFCSGDWVHLFSPLSGLKFIEVRLAYLSSQGGLRPTGQAVKNHSHVKVWVKEFRAEAAMGRESTQSLLVHLPLNTQESQATGPTYGILNIPNWHKQKIIFNTVLNILLLPHPTTDEPW